MILKLKRKLKKTKWLIHIVIIYILYFYLDYFNVPSKYLKLNINNLNVDFHNSAITILLFSIAYFAVDKINTVKNNNQREIIKTMILETCNNCLFSVNFIKDFKIFELDNNKKQRFYDNIKNPFTYDIYIDEFIKNGYFSLEEYTCLQSIKRNYLDYIEEALKINKQEQINHPKSDSLKQSKTDMKEEYYIFLINDIESIKKMFNN